MRLNVVSRISEDKDFFSSYLKVVAELKKNGIDCQLKFIGKIYNEDVYNKIINDATNNDIVELVSFTRKSIPISEWTNNTDDYYLNVSIGDFVGYSSIDCVDSGFKTLFLNIKTDYTINKFVNYQTFCKDENELFNLIKDISLDGEKMNQIIEKENKAFAQSFYLSNNDEKLLLNVLKGKIF
jgi:hypothetical protein